MAGEPEEPKSFLDRGIHWNDPVARFERAPLIGRLPALGQGSTIGLVLGLTIVGMGLYDWPPGLGGLLFSGGGFALAALSFYIIVRTGKDGSEEDKSGVAPNDVDLAP